MEPAGTLQASLRRVMLVEDEPTYRDLVRDALETLDPPWQIDCYEQGTEAVRSATPIDLALVDLGLPDVSGVEVIRALAVRHPGIPIIVISAISNERRVVEAIQAGACGYILKQDDALSIGRAVDQVLQGVYPISPSLARHLVRLVQSADVPQADAEDVRLSGREQELLECFAGGLSYQEVASRLGVSLSTVQSLVRRLYGKLGAHSRHQALYEARRKGLLAR